jgi:1-Cys peroxiredoxin 6
LRHSSAPVPPRAAPLSSNARAAPRRPAPRCAPQVGDFKIHDYLGSSWGIIFSHPKDYTPVCTTELGEAALQEAEFAKRGVKMIALSCDSVEDHKGWVADIEAARGAKVTYPIISDPKRETAVLLGMLDEDEKDNAGIPATVRKVFLLGPDKKVKLQLIYPTAVGRNFAEILRCIDALQLAATHPIATPVNWQKGQDVMIQPSVTDEKAAELFPGFKRTAVPSGKGYIRFTPDPSAAK